MHRDTVTNGYFQLSIRLPAAAEIYDNKLAKEQRNLPQLPDKTPVEMSLPIISTKTTVRFSYDNDSACSAHVSFYFLKIYFFIILLLGSIARTTVAYYYRPSSVVYLSVCHTSEPCKNG